jgi:mono/diheme cytochrome c family protein
MRRWFTWAAWVVGGLGVLAGGVVLVGLRAADSRMARKVDVPAKPVALRSDAASVERGKYLFSSRGCADCHGADGAGRTFVDDGSLRIRGPNISPGPGTVVAGYRPQDWVKAIRHGVHPSGRPLMIMPSEDYNRFTDDDLASLVAYIRQMPPASGGPAVVDLPTPVRVLYGLGAIQDAAAKIDHQLPPAQPVAEGVTVEHGKYVANMCLGCHGAQLEGGRIAGGPPDWPPAARLKPGEGSVMPAYDKPETFVTMFRSGKRPDGSAIGVMPFESLRNMSDVDVKALHLYLKSLK